MTEIEIIKQTIVDAQQNTSIKKEENTNIVDKKEVPEIKVKKEKKNVKEKKPVSIFSKIKKLASKKTK